MKIPSKRLDPQLRAEIYHVALKVREYYEELEKSQDRTSHGTLKLTGYCAVASERIVRMLRARGLPANTLNSSMHWFVIFRGYLIDVTSTQFADRDFSCPISLHRRIIITRYTPELAKVPFWCSSEDC